MADAFGRAYLFVRRWEGNDSRPRPGDPNPTSRGITQDFYDDLAAMQGWPLKSVYDLTEEEVRAAYLALWHRSLCGQMPDPVGWVHFDAVVNMGERQAVRLLQGALGVTIDGALGPKTAAAVRAADPADLAGKLLAARERFYRDLAASKPEKARWLRGWLNRVDDLKRRL